MTESAVHVSRFELQGMSMAVRRSTYVYLATLIGGFLSKASELVRLSRLDIVLCITLSSAISYHDSRSAAFLG